ADRCEIYTDVDGVYSADPRLVPGARLWHQIPHDLMVELATRGAGVLHPRSVELAKQYGVPLCVRSSLNENQGTTLVERTAGMEEFSVAGVTSDPGKMLLSIELMRATAVAALWDLAKNYHLPIVAPQFADGLIRFYTDRDSESEWRKQLEVLAAQGFLKKYRVEDDLVPLSVVGDRFSQDGAALGQVIETLAREQISVTMGTASALAITVAVPATKAEDGVRVLHEEFCK
ncbi:MAG: amino acid kinase family protein, partial [Bdellovibrionota bacterium]